MGKHFGRGLAGAILALIPVFVSAGAVLAAGPEPTSVAEWNQLGQKQVQDGNLDAAIASFERVLAIANSTADKKATAAATGNLAVVYAMRGDMIRAEEMLRKSLKIHEELVSKPDIASDYGNLGNVYRTRGDFARAEEMYRKALKIDEELGNKDGMALRYTNMGVLYVKKGDIPNACAHWRKGLNLWQQAGAPQMVGKIEVLMRAAKCSAG